MDTTAKLTPEEKRRLLAERLRRREDAQRFPTSYPQRRMWFLDRMAPGGTAYNIPAATRVHGPLDTDTWYRALCGITRRHEVLRTTFEEVDGHPVQVVSGGVEPEFSVVDCVLPDGTPDRERIHHLAREEFDRPFDLRQGPLLRTKFLRLGPEEHVLLLTVHHIVADLWSTSVLIRELVSFYAALIDGVEPDLPELPVQYADYTEWQRTEVEGGALDADTEYWVDTLAGAPDALVLPPDRPRPTVQTNRGGSHRFRLSEEVSDRVRALARTEGATSFMTLLAAFTVLLHRYSRENDVVVGTPVANRDRPEIENLIGYFANMVALRTDLSGAPTFREVLSRVRSTALGAFAHQRLPFERLLEVVQPSRDASRTPVFQVSFIFQNITMPTFEEVGLRLEPMEVESRTSRFDLELQVFDGSAFEGVFEYNSDLFDRETVERLSRHLGVLMENLVADPDLPVSRVPLLDADERHRLLTARNDTSVSWSGPASTHRRIEEQAARTPEAEALRCGDSVLGHGELDRLSNRWARLLCDHGMGAGSLVGIRLERSVEMVVAVLAVWKAGGAYVPLDPAFPEERIDFMLRDSGLRILLTQRSVPEPRGDLAPTALCMDELAETVSRLDPSPLGTETPPDSPAYVLYTSGSTGLPKGVVVPHRALDNFLCSMAERPGIERHDVLLAVTTLSFDISVLELLLPLMVGACVIIAPEEVSADGRALAEFLESSDTTMMQATPSTWRMLLDSGWRGNGDLRILVGGEALPEDLARRLSAAGSELWNMYGPTETTVWSSVHEVDDGPVRLGEPIANTTLHVTDDAGQPLPPGVPGELRIGGAGLALGYLGRPELTAERFVEDESGQRLYRTGDLVRRLADGGLEFLGRLDHQVKLRGFRIELGEIEARLREQETVGDAVVTVRKGVSGEEHLVAHIVPDRERGSASSEAWDESVNAWREIWDSAYADGSASSGSAAPSGDGTATGDDFSGWHSSYTAEAIPEEDMRAWADATAESILALEPASVLEIGCGTGVIHRRLRPHLERYWGTDVSETAVERLRAHAEGSGEDPSVSTFFRCPADALDRLPEQLFDTIVVNSVVQYFPDVTYLLRVIEAALTRLAPGGRLFIGDVRSLPLLRAFHTSVRLARSAPHTPPERIRAERERAVADEGELVVSPRLFTGLLTRFPWITEVRVTPKKRHGDQELTHFRYDVVIDTRPRGKKPLAPDVRLDWEAEGATPEALRARLRSERPASFVVTGVPNRRVSAAEPLPEIPDPDDLHTLVEDLGYRSRLDWSEHGEAGHLTLIGHLPGTDEPTAPSLESPSPTEPEWETLVNGSERRRLRRIVPPLREALAASLPDYMVPSSFVLLDAMPLTPNNKIDRNALPDPEPEAGMYHSTFVEPRDETESRLLGLFSEVLGTDRMGVEDSFFELGGHSLLATRLVSRIRTRLHKEVPVRTLFEAPTVRALARRLETPGDGERPVLRAQPRPERLPLSFAQRRLWFLHHIENHPPAHNIPMAVRLRGGLDPEALRDALADVVERHESLRTVFPDEAGVPYQHVLPPKEAVPEVHELRVSATGIRSAVDTACAHAFDLTREPPLHAQILTVDEHDHVLVLVVHHIAADGWSLAPLARDLGTAYTARARGSAPDWSPLPVQYADHTLWQRELLGDASAPDSRWNRQLTHWRETLVDLPERIALPTDRPHPVMASGRGDVHTFRWDESIHRALARIARSHDASEYMVLQAALAVLLSRSGAGHDIPVGTTVAGRTEVATEEMVGFFVNTLVLRTDTSGDPTFEELLSQVRERTLSALDNQDVSFDLLVDELGATRTLAHHPLFQTMLAWQNVPPASLELPGVSVEEIPTGTGGARMDLVFSLTGRHTDEGAQDHIDGTVEYNTDVLDRATVATLVERLERVLSAGTADPGVPISRIDLLSPAERHDLLVTRNDTHRALPEKTLAQLFAQQVHSTPEQPALVTAEEELSYADLDARANRIGHLLTERGVGPGDKVAALLPRSAASVTVMLAVAKVGGVYLPLDVEHPTERTRLVLSDSAPSLLVTTQEHRIPEAAVPHVLIVDSPKTTRELARADSAPPADVSEQRPDSLAYVIHTSGSTGKPKGVAVTHRGLSSLVAAQVEAFGLTRDSRVLQFASPSFDASMAERCDALLSGACLVIADKEDMLPGEPLRRTVEHFGVTNLTLPPSVLAAVPEDGLPSVTSLVVAGEACPPALIERWGGRLRMINAYGPTETTVCATLSDPLTGAQVPPIGRPIANTRVYVLDEGLQPTPAGVPGELWVSGPSLAHGYLNLPELTEERFRPCPFRDDEERMYRTGDLVRWRPDGVLEYLGRTDQQIKLRGVRIEPGEIEAAMAELPGVDRALVMAREDRSGHPTLVGYAVSSFENPPEPAEVRDALFARLPRHMVPSALVVLASLPLNANGKIDHARLPLPDTTVSSSSRPPRTSDEHTLCSVFAKVLGLSEVGAEDRFFDLGGDSIQAIQVVSLARAEGVVISARDVFAHQSPAALASTAHGNIVTADEGTGPIGTTPIREWLYDSGAPVSEFAHTVAVTVPAEVTEESLSEALNAVVSHHPALRTRVRTGADGQRLLDVDDAPAAGDGPPLRVVDVSGTARAALDGLVTEHAAQERSLLAPEAGAMVRGVWFDAGTEHPGRLVLVVHHLVVDGVSWRILLQDLRAAWEAVHAAEPPLLPPNGTSAHRWSELLAAEAVTPARVAELPAWRALLEGVPELVPERRGHDDGTGGLTSVLPPEETTDAVDLLPAALGLSSSDVLLACLGMALHPWRAERFGVTGPVLVDVEGHGRGEHLAPGTDLSRTVGWFTSLHPVRFDTAPVDPGEAPAPDRRQEIVERLRAQLAAVPGDGLGYGLLRYLHPEAAPELRALPSPSIVFNHLGRWNVPDEMAVWEPENRLTEGVREASTESLVGHPLQLNTLLREENGDRRLVADWSWSRELLSEEDVRSLTDLWRTALRTVTTLVLGKERDNEGTPLSFAQADIVRQPVDVEDPHHCVVTATRLRGQLDVQALRDALDEVVERHESLRTRFDVRGTVWSQTVSSEGRWPLKVIDASTDPSPRARLLRLVQDEGDLPFDLAEGPPVRGTLVRTAPEEHTLVLTMHHIVVDPWSYGIIVREVSELHNARVHGRTPALPPAESHYSRFAAAQDRRWREGELEHNRAYWRRLLDGLPPTPRFGSAGPDAPAGGYTRSFALSRELTRAVHACARRESTTVFSLLLSVFHVLLRAHSGEDDIPVGFPLAGRERPGSENMVGFLVNPVFVRPQAARGTTFRELLARVSEEVWEAHEHQEAPLRALSEGLGEDHNPLRLLFNLVTASGGGFSLEGVEASPMPVDTSDPSVVPELVTDMKPHNVDLYLMLHETEGVLRGLWLYSPERVSPSTMAAMERQWPALVERVVEDTTVPFDTLLTPPSEPEGTHAP